MHLARCIHNHRVDARQVVDEFKATFNTHDKDARGQCVGRGRDVAYDGDAANFPRGVPRPRVNDVVVANTVLILGQPAVLDEIVDGEQERVARAGAGGGVGRAGAVGGVERQGLRRGVGALATGGVAGAIPARGGT